MGDAPFSRIYDRLANAPEPVRVLSALSDEEVAQALAAASRERDPYLSNVLGTEAIYRMRVHGAAFATMNEALIVLDESGTVTYLNPAGEELLGWRLSEVVGRRLHDVAHKWDSRGRPIPFDSCAIMSDVFARRAVRGRFDSFTRNGGERIPIEYASAPIVREGVLEGAVLVISDTSERLRAERTLRESEERFHSFFVTHPDAIFSIGADARLTAINAGTERISGYRAEEILGRPFLPFVASEDLDRVLASFTRILAGSTETIEFSIVRKDGTRAVVEVTGTPTRHDGTIVGVQGAAKDVTFERSAKSALAANALRQRFLADLGQESLSTTDLTRFLDGTMTKLAAVLGVDFAKFLEIVPGAKTLRMRAGHGWKPGHVGVAEVGTGLDSQAGYTLAVGEPVVVRDLASERRFRGPRLLSDHGAASGMSCVVRTPGKVHGVLGVHARRLRTYTSADVDFLVAVASLLAGAIHRVETERDLVETREKTKLFLASLTDHATALLSPDATIEQWSGAAEDFTGLRAAEVIGTSFPIHFAAGSRGVVLDALAGAGTGGRRETEAEFLHGDSDPFRARVTATAFSDGAELRGYAVVLEDLRRDAKDPEALRLARREFEARARVRNQELSRAHQELEAFSYTVAHDLRAPLRGIEYFSAILEDDFARELGEGGRDILARLRTEATRGSRLVSDLLDLAKVKRAPLVVEELDLSAMVREIAQELASQAPSRIVHWRIDPGVRARGDPQLLRQALDNLVGNAWKYTAGKEEATIAFRVNDEGLERTYVVEDDGAGFDPRRRGELFRPFARLHTASEFEGTGVGLAIVARIVERHGGHVSAESTGPGRGALFAFTLD